ncbi:hypothetical protein D3C83_204290 [compost metagenome]
MFCIITSRQANRMQQLVLISGRYTPKARYNVGKYRCTYISTNCTAPAMTRMYMT